MRSINPIYPKPGPKVRVKLPHSEACMHLKIAGQVREVALTESGNMVQVYNHDGSPLSFPITPGEGGFYYDRELKMHYVYPQI